MLKNINNQECEKKPEVDKEELASISNVILFLTKAVKALKLYLPNNPLHKKFFDQLTLNLESHLENFGDLKLNVEQFEMQYRGHAVYQNIEVRDSLAFKLNSDGIISISFLEGIEKSEVFVFLDIIGQETSYETDDDIVTRLWTKNLSHIEYEVLEDEEEFDGDSIGTERSSSATQQKGIEQANRIVSKTAPVPPPQNILTMTDAELAWIKKTRDFEEKRKPVDDVINILKSILLSIKELSTFKDFLSVTVNIIMDLIETDEFTYSLDLIDFLLTLDKNREATGDFNTAISEAKKSILSEKMISGLEKILDETDNIKPAQLKKLILMFGNDAIKQVCNLLGVAKRKDIRIVIIECLVEIGREQPEEFYRLLKDKKWYLVRNAVLILRLMEDHGALKYLRKLVIHQDPRVRKEVLLYLETTTDEAAHEQLLRFLSDNMKSFRISTLRILIKLKYQKALKQILTIVKSENFDKKEISEKRIFFEAVGVLGSDEVTPFLRKMVMKKHWFNKSKEKEEVICATEALIHLNSNSKNVSEILNEAVSAKKGEIKEVVKQALKTVMTSCAK